MDMKTSQPKILFFVTKDWFVCSRWLPLIEGAKIAGFEVVTRTYKHAEKILRLGVGVILFEISRHGSNLFREFMTILRLDYAVVLEWRKTQDDLVSEPAIP